jgi:hypothetical protein
MDAACAVRDGNVLVALTIASEAAEKKHGAGVRELLGKVVLAEGKPEAKVELQHVKGPNYELDLPKEWKTKPLEQAGAKSLLIVPPCGEAEYVIQIIGTDPGPIEKATEPGAIQQLRDLVKQLAPALAPVGDAETLQASGLPASGVTYSGRNEKDETILVRVYLALKGKQAVVMLVVGKEPRDRDYGAHARRAFTTLKFKE